MGHATLRAFALFALSAAGASCMFFRSLDDLSAGRDGGASTAPEDAAGAADGPPLTDAGGTDGPGLDASQTGFCHVVDDAIAAGETPRLSVCFDYDGPDAGAAISGTETTVVIEADDGPSPPNAFVIHAPALPSKSGNGRHLVDVPFVARRVEMAFDVRLAFTPGQASDYVQIASFFRDNVYAYVAYDVVRTKIFIAEQDQRDSGLLNTTLPHAGLVVDLTTWHRIVLDLDFVAAKSSLRVVGGESTLGESLEWPKVNWYGTAWLGTSFIYGNTAPLSMHYDDFALNVW